MSSIYSQELAALASALAKQECAQSHSAKSTRGAARSCGSTGPVSLSTTTYAGLTLSNSPKLTSYAADILANRSAWQDSGVALMMKDISGRRCIELYEKSGRDGSLPKMLLGILSSVLTPLPHRWSLMVTKSGRSLFRLAPLARGTGGIASGLLPTPLASEFRGVTENCLKLKERKVSMLRYFLHFHLNPPYGTSWPHPEFVERLMGYPTGHTVLERSETQSFRRSQRSLAKQSSHTNNSGVDYENA